jgi:putative thiamine transport system ATP-binding protein
MSLVLDRIAIAAGGRALFPPLSLQVAPGTITTVMGPSGSGKSSLLALLSGTLPAGLAATGGASLDGVDLLSLPAHRRRVGILFQDDLLFPHFSVAENLAFAIPAAVRGEDRRRRVTAALAEAELDGYGPRDPAALSGGQRARVALMRALLAEPKALLLDEPFGKLDAALRSRLRSFVFDRVRRLGLPTLLVTHDPADAEAAAGTVVDLADG